MNHTQPISHGEIQSERIHAHNLTTKWVELDNTIRRSNEMVNELKKEREQVEQQLIKVLQDQGYTRPSLKLGNDVINLIENKRKANMSTQLLTQAMSLNGISVEKQEAIMSSLETLRNENSKSSVTLSRKKSRSGRNKTRRAVVAKS